MRENRPRLSVAVGVALLAASSATAGEGDPAPPAEPAARDSLLERTREALTFRGGSGEIRLGGLFAADLVAWDRRNERHSGLEGGDLRPRIDIRRENLRLFVEGDLLGDDTLHPLAEAWYSWEASPALSFKAGLMRVPLGTEYATPEEVLPVVGYSFTSHLDGRTDVGLRAEGSAPGEWGWWQATATGGHGYGLEGRPRQSTEYALRLAARPLLLAGADAEGIAGGWFVGAGFASLASFDDPVELTTPLGSTVFTTADLDGNGGRWLHVDTGIASGPVALGLEVIRGSAEEVAVPGGGEEDMDELTAWTATLAVSLTGERRGWRGGAWTLEPPRSGGGAWEIGLRYSNADIDRALFEAGYANYDPSTQEVRTFSAVLGWRPAEGLRVALGWVKTIADDALTVFGGTNPDHAAREGGDGRDSSFVLRLEVSF